MQSFMGITGTGVAVLPLTDPVTKGASDDWDCTGRSRHKEILVKLYMAPPGHTNLNPSPHLLYTEIFGMRSIIQIVECCL